MTGRRTRELLRIGRALPDLPTLDEVFGQGKLGWTKVREISRVASPEAEAAWTERALELNSRQLEGLVSAAVAGEACGRCGQPHVRPPRQPERSAGLSKPLWPLWAALRPILVAGTSAVVHSVHDDVSVHGPRGGAGSFGSGAGLLGAAS